MRGSRVAADTDDAEALRAVVGQLRTHLEMRGRSGLQGVGMGKSPRTQVAVAAVPVAAAEIEHEHEHEHVNEHEEEMAVASEKPRIGKQGLQVVRDDLGDCKRCKLAPSRTNLVYGVGNPDADLVFVGEAPGADEDAQGEPFVGKAGQLLTKMIEAMGYSRSDVYICNVLKCRPPGNRNPEPDEIAQCEPFLRRQVELLQPKIILAMGRFAMQALLGSTEPLGRLRGQVHRYNDVPVVVTYHPAYLLRNLPDKAKAWADLCLAQSVLREQA